MQKHISALFVGIFLFMTFILSSSQYARATEEYAKQTGQTCATCHLDPAGGGELTAVGKTFTASGPSVTESHKTVNVAKLLRLLVGYIHFLTAIFWFGTILYVHLVLKPAYAASGLPRGELRVGIASMIIMGVTGAVLAIFRINSVDTLIHSHFGILLIIKVSLYLIMVISAVIVITMIGPRLKAKRKGALKLTTTDDLTPEELAGCDGKEGRPAYFSFEGKVYDATQSNLWKQGVHMGRHNAGIDLTDALKQAPHGPDKVSAMREVGLLIVDGPQKMATHERVFYFMAYMNLTIVLIIILILALWRWG
ncbi:MAG: cytochrome B5 [Geobacteraceae bacterium]|nr:cytochrome B5 [Geobacteraceae bacterium]